MTPLQNNATLNIVTPTAATNNINDIFEHSEKTNNVSGMTNSSVHPPIAKQKTQNNISLTPNNNLHQQEL